MEREVDSERPGKRRWFGGEDIVPGEGGEGKSRVRALWCGASRTLETVGRVPHFDRKRPLRVHSYDKSYDTSRHLHPLPFNDSNYT